MYRLYWLPNFHQVKTVLTTSMCKEFTSVRREVKSRTTAKSYYDCILDLINVHWIEYFQPSDITEFFESINHYWLYVNISPSHFPRRRLWLAVPSAVNKTSSAVIQTDLGSCLQITNRQKFVALSSLVEGLK